MSLRVEGVHLTLKKNHILKGVSFAVDDGELLSLLGPSGAGKSTMIRVICGLQAQDEGHVFINDECMDGVAAHKRGTVVVFQDIRLFPNMTVAENVAYPLRMRGVGKSDRLKRADELLQLVQLDGLGGRHTNEISGGQQQRVALARALAGDPKVLLLDEPFSGLDEDLRDDMRTLLLNLHNTLGTTIIMVTHDAAEALMMSDRIVYIRDGSIVQDAEPRELYEQPASLDVACCFGNCSTLAGEVRGGAFRLGDLEVPCAIPDGPATLVIRHDGISPQPDSKLCFDVAQSVYRGNSHLVHLAIEGQTLVLQWPEGIAEGQRVPVGMDLQKAYCFAAEGECC